MRNYLIVFITLGLMLTGCSWQEYFIISNMSDDDIQINYFIDPEPEGFSLFEDNPEAYQANSSGTIDWNRKMQIIDQDSTFERVVVNLPAKSVLKFGTLSNDHYTSHDQYFINDRHFNLIRIEIITGTDAMIITKEIFDSYFRKKDGMIRYLVR